MYFYLTANQQQFQKQLYFENDSGNALEANNS